MPETVRLLSDARAAVTARYARALDKAVRAVALQIVAQTQDNILAYPEPTRPIDTGAYRASVGADMGDMQGRAQALKAARARAATPGVKSGRTHKVNEGPPPEPPGELEAVVSVAADYGYYIEVGTDRMPARPSLKPARDEVAAQVEQVVARYLRRV